MIRKSIIVMLTLASAASEANGVRPAPLFEGMSNVLLRAYPIDLCGTGFQPVKHTGGKPVPHVLG